MKTKKILAIFTIIAMLISMMSTFAFAANDPIKELGPDDNASVQAAITKALTTGKGDALDSTIKGLTYKFKITQNTTASVKDGSPSAQTNNLGPHPAATQVLRLDATASTEPQEVSITTSDAANKASASDNAANDYYRKESGNIISQDFASKVTTQGIFVYDIEEVWEDSAVKAALEADGWTQDGTNKALYKRETTVNGEKTTETFTMSKAAYQLRVYTKLKENGAVGTPGDYYVSAITLVQIKTEAGEDIDNGPKKDPTPGGDNTTYETSQLEFQNRYLKTEETDPTNPNDQPYELSKRVTGVDQDAKILHGGTKFMFTVKMTLPDGAEKKAYDALYWDSDNNAKWVKLEEGGSQKTTSFDFTGKADGEAVTQTIELEHDQKVTFPNVPVGTRFEVVEDDYFTTGIEGSNVDSNNQAITYKLKAVINGGTVPADDVAAAEAARTDTQIVAKDVSKASAYVNDGGQGTTPAGIIMQYIPFMVIILLAMAALVASAVIKGKRRSVQ